MELISLRENLLDQPHERRQRRRVPNEPLITHSQYKPPELHEYDEGPVSDTTTLDQHLFFNGPEPLYSQRRQQNQSQRASLQLNHHQNHTKDLAGGVLSYGVCCCKCVRTQEVGVLENCGSFQRMIPPGFYCLFWPFFDIPGRLSLRLQQMDVMCETKTQDDVFVQLELSIQYRVAAEHSYDAYYTLNDPAVLLRSYIFDVVRTNVPKLTIHQVFLNKRCIADAIHTKLGPIMYEYGYEIFTSLVTNVVPCAKVRDAMNEMEAAKRMKHAMPHRAEAEKIRIIKNAEAKAESMYLHGLGLAKARCAIAEGMKGCVMAEIPHHSTKDIMDILLLTQYMDMLCAVGGNDLILSHSPGNVNALCQALPTTNNTV